jgi:sensor c-di-GMP phosphodiesterase-like protein
MKRTLKIRALVALTATIVSAACGLLIGYWIGRTITLRLTAGKLNHEAARAISEGDMYARDVHGALDAMYVSGYEYCSKRDMELLSHLLYTSQFLKEIGRIRDNRIACSTTLGSTSRSSIELPRPDAIGTDGVKAYRNIPLFRLSNIEVVALRADDSYVVLYPYFDGLREPSTIHKKVTTVSEAERDQPLPMAGVAVQPSWQQLTTNSDLRIGEMMFSTRCSSLSINHICTTAYLPVSEALQANRGELKAFTVLGGLTGALFGVVLSIFYRRNRSMEHQLRRAIRKDQLRVVYQPIVDLANGRIVGAEALARWTDEDGFAVGPDVFIKIAEERGFVGSITRLVVRHVLRDFAATLRAHPDFRVSINVAAADLGDPEFLPMLNHALERAGVAARSVVIEITEGSTVQYKTAMEAIVYLHQQGHSVHIDDFGTGYSSLSYLHDLSVDVIKIDKSFTQTVGTKAVTSGIVPQILSIAEALNLRVIAEGIETPQQSEYFAAQTQPILGQGWLFSRAVAPAEFHRMLAADEKKAQAVTEAV